MDNFDITSGSSPDSEDPNKPIPFDDKPIPFDDSDTDDTNVSHSPLKLDDSETTDMPKIEVAKPVLKKTAEKITSEDQITGVKTFFTKLHAGSLDFIDDQIARWLKGNPGVVIKRTNTVTGMVEGKKTEPNIIITVWY